MDGVYFKIISSLRSKKRIFASRIGNNKHLGMATTKYIFVTGGVSSSLGKGIIAASLAKLFQARGYWVTIQKLDPTLM